MLTQATDSDVDYDPEMAELSERLAHIPVPAGATTDSCWSTRSDDGDVMRSLEWSRRYAGRACVHVDGWQGETGHVTRWVSVYDSLEEMPADEARQLAAALVEAADELERLQ